MILCGSIFFFTFFYCSLFVDKFWYFGLFYCLAFSTCHGLTYMAGVHHGWLWFPNNAGLVSGIILAGFGFGPFIINFLSTKAINPWGD